MHKKFIKGYIDFYAKAVSIYDNIYLYNTISLNDILQTIYLSLKTKLFLVITDRNGLTLMLLVANLANTKRCKKNEKLLKP